MNRIVSLSVLLILIVLLGSMMFHVIAQFILPLFIAAVLAVISQPLHRYFLRKTGERNSWAAALSTLTLVGIIVVPVVVGTFVSAVQFYSLAEQHLDGDWHRAIDLLWNRILTPLLEKVKPWIPESITSERLAEFKQQFADNLQKLSGQIARRTFQLASSTLEVVASYSIAGGTFITALYYFLADGPALIAAAEDLIPLPVDHQRRLCERFAKVVRAVVTATFLAAFIQGFATAIALQFCGLGHFWIFLAVATVASLIPLVGAWIIWVPCAIWLGLQGQWTAAALLAVWGAGVVSMLDNGVKMYVLQNDADLHPLLAFISVIGALQVLGLWGIFIGPIVASCLFAMIQIFNTELKEFVNERSQSPDLPPETESAIPETESRPGVGNTSDSKTISNETTMSKAVTTFQTKVKPKRRRS